MEQRSRENEAVATHSPWVLLTSTKILADSPDANALTNHNRLYAAQNGPGTLRSRQNLAAMADTKKAKIGIRNTAIMVPYLAKCNDSSTGCGKELRITICCWDGTTWNSDRLNLARVRSVS